MKYLMELLVLPLAMKIKEMLWIQATSLTGYNIDSSSKTMTVRSIKDEIYNSI